MKFKFPVLVIIPPPLLYVLTFLVSFKLESLFPIGMPGPEAIPALPWIGVVLIVIGAALAFPSALGFVITRTTIVPHAAPKKLVVKGTYRISRNPMYLGISLIYVGVALRLGVVWPLLMSPIPLGVMNFVVIPFEENNLKGIFGGSYAEYSQRVRRWI